MPSNNSFCVSCEQGFRTAKALQQHYNQSPRHNRCSVCSFDGSDWEELLQHHRDSGHRAVCQGCDDGEGMVWAPGSVEYLDHLRDENVCTKCEEHFDSPSNLEHHGAVHLPRSIECYGCYRKFKTFYGMILHIENDGCPSGIDALDLNESAAMCFQWKAFIDPDFRDEMLDRCDFADIYNEPVYPFFCSACDVDFAKLSALFQHVSSSTCPQELNKGKIGKLVRWLEKEHMVSGSE